MRFEEVTSNSPARAASTTTSSKAQGWFGSIDIPLGSVLDASSLMGVGAGRWLGGASVVLELSLIGPFVVGC